MIPCAAGYAKTEDGRIVPLVEVDGSLRECTFAAMPGSQASFLALDDMLVLFVGTRGCSKTLSAIMDFCQFCGVGFGADWKGIFLRRTYNELMDAISQSKIWIPKIFEGAVYNKMEHEWRFPGGETLRFSYLLDDSELESQRFLGHSYSWVCCDELCAWPNLAPMQFMLSTLRCPNPKVPLRMRCLTNPWGPGRSAVVEYFGIDASFDVQPRVGKLITGDGPNRRVVNGSMSENVFLDPGYLGRVLDSTDDESKQKAHAYGSWAVPSESLYADIFTRGREYIEIEAFEILDPHRIRLAYDHGSLAPFSVLAFYEATGEDLTYLDGKRRPTKRGDLHVVGEIYGGKKNVGLKFHVPQIAERIKDFIKARGWPDSILKKENVADSACWQDDGRPSIASDFEKAGINFIPANKGNGSRAQGVQQIRKWLSNTIPVDGERVAPGLFIVKEACPQLLQHLPFMQRDPKNPEAADNSAGVVDHDHEALGYYLMREPEQQIRSGRIDAGVITWR
jgi:hypothetical protein